MCSPQDGPADAQVREGAASCSWRANDLARRRDGGCHPLEKSVCAAAGPHAGGHHHARKSRAASSLWCFSACFRALQRSDSCRAPRLQVAESSPAHKGGIKPGDVLIEMDSASVTHTAQVYNLLGLQVGRKIPVKVVRGQKQLSLNIVTEASKL